MGGTAPGGVEPRLGGSPETAMLLDGGEFGRISLKDRRLLQDALILGCDAFLTMERERKLPAVADQVLRATGLRILRPPTGRSCRCAASGSATPDPRRAWSACAGGCRCAALRCAALCGCRCAAAARRRWSR